MGHGRDRRHAKRISYVCELECEAAIGAAGSSAVATRISDLSMTGAFVDSMIGFAPGTILTLTFLAGETMVRTSAQVRYIVPKIGMGVQFVDLTHAHSAALEFVIKGEPVSASTVDWPHGSNAATSQSDQKLFLGSFTVISLFDVIQMVENSRLTGVLTISLHSVEGTVNFIEGEIVGAAANGSTGPGALSKLLDAVEGTFEFRKSGAHFERTINAPSNIGLLLDLLRASDEEAALQ